MVGTFGDGRLELAVAHRFPNAPIRLPDGWHWDVVGLYGQVLDGLRAAASSADIAGVGVDSWAIDYGLVGPEGALLGTPFAYRDPRGGAAVDGVHAHIPAARWYEITGLQHLPFTTVYQLAAEAGGALIGLAESLLLVPDLIGFWLSGSRVAELTNASTTGLLDVRAANWSAEILAAIAIPGRLLPEIVTPGTDLGALLPEVRSGVGLPASTRLTAVGSHDTASAVVAVPAVDSEFAYISCGTWALAGVELTTPLITEAGRQANFTNELGVDGTVRYLRNVMGLWILQETLRTWRSQGDAPDLDGLLAAAADLPAGGPMFDVDDPDLLPPGEMVSRVRRACERAGVPVPQDPVAVVRCILDSLAVAMADAVHRAAELTGVRPRVIHLVGGGSRNTLLCRLLADASGLPVEAGPAEATAIGNVLVQARAAGTLEGDLFGLRSLVRRTQAVIRYEPRGDPR